MSRILLQIYSCVHMWKCMAQPDTPPKTTLMAAQCADPDCCVEECASVQDAGGLDLCLGALSTDCRMLTFNRETLPPDIGCVGTNGTRLELTYKGVTGVGVFTGVFV
eukprot:Gregarina_sp_Poly_1__7221@NODE_396_length_8945_cov_116_430728_g324_i0_p10_GENE_NODE_396_length_8945_cov_116_430728_g324_i0NODE_396_length_8945_cov_116_430728_g324_i0_p10_ORF_typecomplete_len107_score7_37_NODE_396_length_8945_cov_116_430728_g324_i051285448